MKCLNACRFSPVFVKDAQLDLMPCLSNSNMLWYFASLFLAFASFRFYCAAVCHGSILHWLLLRQDRVIVYYRSAGVCSELCAYNCVLVVYNLDHTFCFVDVCRCGRQHPFLWKVCWVYDIASCVPLERVIATNAQQDGDNRIWGTLTSTKYLNVCELIL